MGQWESLFNSAWRGRRGSEWAWAKIGPGGGWVVGPGVEVLSAVWSSAWSSLAAGSRQQCTFKSTAVSEKAAMQHDITLVNEEKGRERERERESSTSSFQVSILNEPLPVALSS